MTNNPSNFTKHFELNSLNFDSKQNENLVLAQVTSALNQWRQTKTSNFQPIPPEIKQAVIKILKSGLFSKSVLAKQLSFSHSQLAKITKSDAKNLKQTQTTPKHAKRPSIPNNSKQQQLQDPDFNFLPFKIVPQQQQHPSLLNTAISSSKITATHNSQKNDQSCSENLNNNDIVLSTNYGLRLTLPVTIPIDSLLIIIKLLSR